MGINNTGLTGSREDGVKSKSKVTVCLQGVTVSILVQPLESLLTLFAFSCSFFLCTYTVLVTLTHTYIYQFEAILPILFILPFWHLMLTQVRDV